MVLRIRAGQMAHQGRSLSCLTGSKCQVCIRTTISPFPLEYNIRKIASLSGHQPGQGRPLCDGLHLAEMYPAQPSVVCFDCNRSAASQWSEKPRLQPRP